MSESDRLYALIQKRLREDGLIGASVRRARGEAALDLLENDFHFWQVETVYPQYVNNLTTSIGEKVK